MFHKKEAQELIRTLPAGGRLSNLLGQRDTYTIVANGVNGQSILGSREEVRSFIASYRDARRKRDESTARLAAAAVRSGRDDVALDLIEQDRITRPTAEQCFRILTTLVSLTSPYEYDHDE